MSQSESECPRDSTAVYKLNSKAISWEKITNLKSKRNSHQSFIIEGNVYLTGGCNNGLLLENTEVMTVSKNMKNKTLAPPPMHNKRHLFGVCSFAGCVLVAGGI